MEVGIRLGKGIVEVHIGHPGLEILRLLYKSLDKVRPPTVTELFGKADKGRLGCVRHIRDLAHGVIFHIFLLFEQKCPDVAAGIGTVSYQIFYLL